MVKNYYKKYYESHKEQEKQRYLAYYYANRERILAKQREKRKNAPKKVKLTANDYKKLWLDLLSYTKHSFPFWCLIMEKSENERLQNKKEMLKDE